MINDYFTQNDKVAEVDFQKMVSVYVNYYLPKQKGASPNTIRSYKETLTSLIFHISEHRRTKSSYINFTDIRKGSVNAYLDDLLTSGRSVSTRNQRRGCICAFLRYASTIDPTLEYIYREIRQIPITRAQEGSMEESLTIEELNLVFRQIDKNPNPRLQFRDKAIVLMLYDTAARISELLNIRLNELYLNRKDPYVILHGKGRRDRSVAISGQTVTAIKNHLLMSGIPLNKDDESPLFFVQHRGVKEPMDSDTVRSFLKTYEKLAKAESPDFKKKLHPHLFRATRATHLLDQGVDIYTISKFLGHKDISTTEQYLRISPEAIYKNIAKSSTDPSNPLHGILDPTKVKLTDKEKIARYYGLA